MNESATVATDELKRALAAEHGAGRWIRRIGTGIAIAAAVGVGVAWRAAHRPKPPAKYTYAEISRGDVIEKVQATGTVQPVLQVNVGAQVNGRVTRVNVDYNLKVKKGDVLAEIDATIYGAQASAQQANVLTQQAQLSSAKANEEAARLNFERAQKLFEQHLASQSELDAARGSYEVAKANSTAAEATIGATRAQLTQSLTNVGFTKIYSPVDGIVISRAVDPGATVVASFQTPTLFVIAQDLRKMRVFADVDEADVGKVHEQMSAEAVVDAFPGETFTGVVTQVRFSPNNVQGVVTYSAVVDIENAEEKLRPGMTATITIRTREAKNVPRIPNAALRYKPSPPKKDDDKAAAAAPKVVVLPEPPLAKGTGKVYALTDSTAGSEKAVPRILSVGITDGIFTEVNETSVQPGLKVITDELDEAEIKKRSRRMF